MRLNSHHLSSESTSLSRERSLESATTETNNQHHRHQSTSNSETSITQETPNDHNYQPQNNLCKDHLEKANLPTNTKGPPTYPGLDSSDNQIKNPYNTDYSNRNIDHQSHHLPKNKDDQYSKSQFPTETNTDDEEEEEGHQDQEKNNIPNNSSYHPSSSSMTSTNPSHGETPYNYATAGANEMFNRYCLEQTIRHLHEYKM